VTNYNGFKQPENKSFKLSRFQILRLVGRSETQYDMYKKICVCLSYKYCITSIQFPWVKRHLTDQIWGELFTSTTICPSNDQRVMRRGLRSVPSRGLPTIDSFWFVNILHHTIHSLCCSCWYKFRDRPSSRFKKLSC
jgi:hypothetical protein